MDLAALHDEALTAARLIEDPKERAGEIATLAILRPVEERDPLIQESADAARLIEDPKERSRALTYSIHAATKTAR